MTSLKESQKLSAVLERRTRIFKVYYNILLNAHPIAMEDTAGSRVILSGRPKLFDMSLWVTAKSL